MPPAIAWRMVALAAALMLATLPGRTQGLGLITESLLSDLQMERVTYANLNFWATLLGSICCLPAGWMLDRFGLRWPTTGMLLLLGLTVGAMSRFDGGTAGLFILILLTRAIGQSALSVASITAAGKGGGSRQGMAMGFYAVLLSIFFAAAFVGIGEVVSHHGWRTAWSAIAGALALIIAPLAATMLPAGIPAATTKHPFAVDAHGDTLPQALRTPAFWVFGGAIALFGLVSSGLGLFNEAVLAERGFDQKIYHHFLAAMTVAALAGQFLCGWLMQKWSLSGLTGIAMFLYAVSLAGLPVLKTPIQLWATAAVIGMAAGMITVIFFAVWGRLYGQAHLGRIQGAAQMLSVFASAIGPVLFAWCQQRFSSFTPVLFAAALIVMTFGIAASRLRQKPYTAPTSPVP